LTYGAVTRVRLHILATVLLVGLAVGFVSSARADGAPDATDPLSDDVEADEPARGFPDPFEPVNRGTFAVNRKLDDWVIEPITKFYRFCVPTPARRAVRRALVNLDAPVTFVNDVLQLEPVDAAVTATRFVVNTTVGVAGLFDVAGDLIDLKGHQSDFGQTLALTGIPSGPYLIIPLLGPNNTRDFAGYVVDFLFRPTTYLLTPGGTIVLTGFVNPGPEFLFTTIFEGSTELAEGIADREAAGDALAALEASSLDYYAALRNAYYQNRVALIWRRGPDRGPLARAKWALAALSLRPPRSQVRDLRTDGREQRVEAVALEH
jgi:phospholipid-binding lipoprotein MlaA